jgi:O-succinylbenzoate synthase
MLKLIQPQFIILKPSLLGGFKASKEWISHADSLGIDWWVTSALESNVGLNAIAQWTYSLNAKGPQGLGTGSLFTNNIQSPLVITKACLSIDNSISWDLI